MFPMVTEPWEFDAAKAVFDGQLAFLRSEEVLPEAIRYGAMLEVPRWPNASICWRRVCRSCRSAPTT
jgi:phosphoenolpyruvate-protein kinase (PTS system EI component)